jgi:hypothetical protein
MTKSAHAGFNIKADIINLDNMHQARTPIFWSVDPADGVIQGPLDLEFIKDRPMVLSLESNQVAVHCVNGEMHSVHLDGSQTLGPLGPDDGDKPRNSQLLFMHVDAPISVPWRQHIPVAPTSSGDPTSRLAHGTFVVQIIDPVRFYRSFLVNKCGDGEDVCRDALAQLLPTFLAIHLARLCGPGATLENQNNAIATLQAGDLDTVLSPYGISCLAVSMNSGIQQTAEELSSQYSQPELVGCS